MTERYEALKTEIVHTSDRWQTLMNLSWFTIEHTFVESFKEDEPDTICNTDSHWEYKEGRMRWYLASASRLTPEELDLTVVHEWAHVLAEPMEKHVKTAQSEQCEYAVTCISKALIAVRDYYEAPAGSRLPMMVNEILGYDE